MAKSKSEKIQETLNFLHNEDNGLPINDPKDFEEFDTTDVSDTTGTEELQQAPVPDTRKMVFEADVMTCFTMELLFVDETLDKIIEENEALAKTYGLFGATEGIIRTARLLNKIAPNNPELADSLIKIAEAMTQVGSDATNKINDLEKAGDKETDLLNGQDIATIMKSIENIDVSLPDGLK